MGRESKIRAGRRVPWFAIGSLLVAGLLVAGAVFGWRTGRLNPLICDGFCDASNATAPDGLRPATAAVQAAADPALSPPDDSLVLAAISEARTDPLLGDHFGFAAATINAEGGWETSDSSGAFIPASTTKVLTGFAALDVLGPQTRFATSTVLDGSTLVLVGGGDPFLTDRRAEDDPAVWRADLATLATESAAELTRQGTTSVSLQFDNSLFSGPTLSPQWPDTYVAEGVVSPIQALWVDRGMVDPEHPSFSPRVDDAPQAAAETFADLLREAGIEVTGSVVPGAAPTTAAPVAEVQSSTVGQIVERVIRNSDNEAAEVLLRHLGATQSDASFEGGAAVVVDSLERHGVDLTDLNLDDGSGLSRSNRMTPQTLVETLRVAVNDQRFGYLISDLPVTGFSGSLAERNLDAASGLVRAKTGTLTAVHSLAGIVYDADGRPLIFAVMTDNADRDRPTDAQVALDKVVGAIAECSCGS